MQNEKIYIERIQRWIDQLGKTVYSQNTPLKAEFIYHPDSPIPYSEIDNYSWREISVNEKWADLWGCGWFRFRGQIPKVMTGAFVGAWIDVQGEACVFKNSTPNQGLTNKIDWNLQAGKYFIPLFPKALENESVELLLEVGANGLFGEDKKEYKLEKADIVVYDKMAYKLWMDVRTLFSLYEALPTGKTRKKRILYGLNQACNNYKEGANKEKCLDLTAELLSLPAEPSSLSAWSVGHAHIDVAWLWPVRETKRKCGRTFATALRFIDEYPKYIFGASQAQLYQFVKEDYPELYEEIKDKVKAGQWECQGATWVEMDTNLPSGESLIRQCIYGKRFFKEEFAQNIEFLWLPDCFGYTGSLPQILKKSNVDTFISQKLSWNDTNLFPHHTYRWQGIDGSEVLCHFLPTNDYNFSNLPKSFIESENRFSQADISNDFLNLYGIGDGGGGPSKEHIELGLRQQNLEGVPKFKFAKAVDFIEQIKQLDKEKLPVWKGELYFELHRGTYTTQAKMKKYNRQLENKMQFIEFLSVLTKKNINPDLQIIWKDILLNQFHDIIPGSSIGWVYKDAYELSEKNLNRLDLLQNNLISEIFEKETKSINLLLVNSLSHKRREVFEFKSDKIMLAYDIAGQRLPSYFANNTVYFMAEVPANGYTSVCLKNVDEKIYSDILKTEYLNDETVMICSEFYGADVVLIPDNQAVMENDLFIIEFNEFGEIFAIKDKSNGKQILKSPANSFKLWEDKPNNWGAWDINHFYRETEAELPELLERNILLDTPLKKTIYQKLSIGRSEIRQEISIFKNSLLIEIKNQVDWNERHKMLRVSAMPDLKAFNAVSEIQFGLVDRPTHKNTSWDYAKFEVLAHTFIDLSEGDRGFAILNDCKYGHSVQDDSLEINLLRSPEDVDKEADLGQHSFTFAYYPHNQSLRESDVIQMAHNLNQKVQVFETDYLPNDIEKSLFNISNNKIIISTVKFAENNDDIILRLYEATGSEQAGVLSLLEKYVNAFECNTLEEQESELSIIKGKIQLTFKPFEIKTIRLCSK